MKLSQVVRRELEGELTPLLQPYFEHQGWPSLETADKATEVLLDLLRESKVRI